MPAAWRFAGPLDVAALSAAIGDLVARHEQLRVVFSHEDGVPAQHVLAAADTAGLDVVELPPAVRDGDRAALAEAVREVALRPFDLAAAPPFRATLLRIAADDHVLVLAMHHIVSDGWSLDVLTGDLSACYHARSGAGPRSSRRHPSSTPTTRTGSAGPTTARNWTTGARPFPA